VQGLGHGNCFHQNLAGIARPLRRILKGVLLSGVAVIVTHNSGTEVEACLDALANMAPELTPIVVDNASTDGTTMRVGMRPEVNLIANTENLGFAGAVNQGVNSIQANLEPNALILMLNPDARLLTSVDALAAATGKYGVAAGKLVDVNGEAQKGFTIRRFPTPLTLAFELFGINRLWPSNSINRKYRCLDRDLEAAGPVEQPAGAFLMIRMDVWKQLNGFDIGFHPVWFEDVDFCRRAVDAGVRIQYVPEAIAEHLGGHSVGAIPIGFRALYWCASLLRYAAKHFRPVAYRGICLAVVLSSVPRMVMGMIVSRSLTPVVAYSRVIWVAGLCLLTPRHWRPAVGLT